VRRDANHIHNEWLWEQRQRKWAWSTARSAAGARGEETPSEPKSSGGGIEDEDENKEEGVVTSPPHSPPPEDIPSLGNVFNQQAGISIGVRWPKRPWTGTGALFGPPPQSGLTLVSSNLQGESVALVVTGIAHLLGVL
jgi:hypothetical protein